LRQLPKPAQSLSLEQLLSGCACEVNTAAGESRSIVIARCEVDDGSNDGTGWTVVWSRGPPHAAANRSVITSARMRLDNTSLRPCGHALADHRVDLDGRFVEARERAAAGAADHAARLMP
jgi:hypothetical protein